VQERDAGAADADPRRLVDQAQARLLQRRQRGVDVGHLVGDVVDAGALLGQELADGRVRAEGREELDVVLADVEEHRLDALLGHVLAVDELHVVRLLVEGDRGVEVLDGDAHVVDAREHGARP
jgi:hypothetical protein